MSNFLQSLKEDKSGNWDKAHDLIQHDNSSDAAWIHAYLHRKEGDDWNARYWNDQAGKSFPNMGIEEEFEVLWRHFSNES